MQPGHSRPAKNKQAARRDEKDKQKMNNDDRIGQQIVHNLPCPRPTIAPPGVWFNDKPLFFISLFLWYKDNR